MKKETAHLPVEKLTKKIKAYGFKSSRYEQEGIDREKALQYALKLATLAPEWYDVDHNRERSCMNYIAPIQKNPETPKGAAAFGYTLFAFVGEVMDEFGQEIDFKAFREAVHVVGWCCEQLFHDICDKLYDEKYLSKHCYRIVAETDPYHAETLYHNEEVIEYRNNKPVRWIHDDNHGNLFTKEEALATLLDIAEDYGEGFADNYGFSAGEETLRKDSITFTIEKIKR